MPRLLDRMSPLSSHQRHPNVIPFPAEPAQLLFGAGEAFRPVLLTTVLAALGLIPAAVSHAMGSETQRPFAISIVSGLLLGIPAILFVMPLVYGSLLGLKRRPTQTPAPQPVPSA